MKRSWLMAVSVATCASALLLGMPGCDDDDNDTDEAAGLIGGNVVSFHAPAAAARLAAAVQGVEVTAHGSVTRTTTTDANGVFSFPDLPPGDYTLSFRYNGLDASYTLNGVAVVLTLAAGQQILLVDIELEDGVLTVGHVLVCNIGEDCEPPAEPVMLAAPRLLSPADGSVINVEPDIAKRDPSAKVNVQLDLKTTVTLKWKAVPGAAAYVVEVEGDQAVDRRLVEPNYVRIAKKLVVGTSYNINLPLGMYRWRVRGVDETGAFGRASHWWTFIVTTSGSN